MSKKLSAADMEVLLDSVNTGGFSFTKNSDGTYSIEPKLSIAGAALTSPFTPDGTPLSTSGQLNCYILVTPDQAVANSLTSGPNYINTLTAREVIAEVVAASQSVTIIGFDKSGAMEDTVLGAIQDLATILAAPPATAAAGIPNCIIWHSGTKLPPQFMWDLINTFGTVVVRTVTTAAQPLLALYTLEA
jgi:hypothetical protein